MAINTHGLKLTGIRSLAGSTKGLQGYYSTGCIEVFFDRTEGTTWGKYQVSRSTWTRCDSPDVIRVGSVYDPHTMQELADMIAARLHEIDCLR